MLLSGMETSSEYFTFMITAVLFSSPIDEGRDDIDDYPNYYYYSDDLYTPGAFPNYMTFSVTTLGITSIFSASMLEEFFLDMNFLWTTLDHTHFSWIDLKGSILIALPFFSMLLSEFDSSRTSKNEDFNYTPLLSRFEHRYQTLLLNADLWFYEQIISRGLKKFYEFSNFFANQSLDKAYFEYFYVQSVNKITVFFNDYNKYNFNSMEKAYPSSFFFIVSSSIFFFYPVNFIWVISVLFSYEIFYFFVSISGFNFNHDGEKKL
jgi:NADH-ubiquinone oxidoreductase chain 5